MSVGLSVSQSVSQSDGDPIAAVDEKTTGKSRDLELCLLGLNWDKMTKLTQECTIAKKLCVPCALLRDDKLKLRGGE